MKDWPQFQESARANYEQDCALGLHGQSPEPWASLRPEVRRLYEAEHAERVGEGRGVAALHRIALTPGSMGLAALAIDLFGAGRVDPGSWATPVYVRDVTGEEIEAATSLLAEQGVRVERLPS